MIPMPRMISAIAITMVMALKRICLRPQNIIEKQINKVKASWEIVGSGNLNMIQVLNLKNENKIVLITRIIRYENIDYR
jgi:LEA14-like dessication related protein